MRNEGYGGWVGAGSGKGKGRVRSVGWGGGKGDTLESIGRRRVVSAVSVMLTECPKPSARLRGCLPQSRRMRDDLHSPVYDICLLFTTLLLSARAVAAPHVPVELGRCIGGAMRHAGERRPRYLLGMLRVGISD